MQARVQGGTGEVRKGSGTVAGRREGLGAKGSIGQRRLLFLFALLMRKSGVLVLEAHGMD